MAVLVAVDLLSFSGRYVRSEPSPKDTPNLKILRDLSADPAGARLITHTSAEVPTQVATWCGVFGVRNIQGTNPLFLRQYIDYLYYSQTGELPPGSDAGFMHHNGFFVMSPVESPMIRMLNPSYFIKHSPTLPSATPVWPLSEDKGYMSLERIPGSLGEVWAVPGYRVIPSRETMLETMRRDDFNPRASVLLSEDPRLPMKPLEPDAAKGAVKALITVVHAADDELVVSATVDRDALLVFSEIFYPGWRCTVDGVPTSILRANDILRAVYVKAGTHRVVMQFRPQSFLVGLLITVFTAIVMVILIVLEMRQRRRSLPIPSE